MQQGHTVFSAREANQYAVSVLYQAKISNCFTGGSE